MKLSFLIMAAVIGTALPMHAIHAQDEDALKNEINSEIDALLPKVKLHRKAKRTRSQSLQLVSQDAAAESGSSNTGSNTSFNANENNSAATAGTSTSVNVQVTETPTQTVEAAPLTESKLDRLKKNRLDIERSTEEKIVEKLETDRIERERRRNDKTNSITFEEEKRAEAEINKLVDGPQITQVQVKETITPIQAQDSVVVIPPAKVEPAKEYLEADFSKVDKKPEDDRLHWFVGANAGLGDYSAQNVKGIYAAGITLGVILPERIIVEGGLLFSSYDVVAQPYYGGAYPYAQQIQMDQRNYSLGVKYQLTNTRIRPVAGVAVSYTTRQFIDPMVQRPGSQGYDAALVVGADIALSETFSLGTDLRYFMNLSSRRDQGSYNQAGYGGYAYGYGPYPGVQNGSFIDEINYYVLSINALIRF
jgi:hypothetical protein